MKIENMNISKTEKGEWIASALDNLENPFNENQEFEEGDFDISNFPEEMQQVLKFNQDLDKYYEFLDSLSRDDLLVLLKQEVLNRVLREQEIK